jgi:protein farnesyltransferase/geranylgeranyltransferase type-1 subunit alpha
MNDIAGALTIRLMEAGGAALANWTDVTPIDAELGLSPVVQISHEPQDAHIIDLFSAVLVSGELSERVLKLTEEVGAQLFRLAYHSNPVRSARQVSDDEHLCTSNSQGTMNVDVHNMLEMVPWQVIAINPSNYNAWEVRWRCLQVLPNTFMEAESDFLDEKLEQTPKNYQLWNYRRRFALERGRDCAYEVHKLLHSCSLQILDEEAMCGWECDVC